MKKIIIPFLCFFVAFTYAQNSHFSKGDYLIVGNSSFSYDSDNSKSIREGDGQTSTNEFKQTSIWFSPEIGYFYTDNLVIGAVIEYSTSKAKTGDEDWSTGRTSTFIGPMGRYYFKGNGFYPFLEVLAGYQVMSDGNSDDNKFSGFGYGGKAGIDYYLSKHFALEGGVSYGTNKLKNARDSKVKFEGNRMRFSVGLVFTLDR